MLNRYEHSHITMKALAESLEREGRDHITVEELRQGAATFKQLAEMEYEEAQRRRDEKQKAKK